MTTQPTSSGAPSPRSIPPDPLVVFAAFMNPLSDERTRYAYWEHQRIMDMIYKLPPPQTPDSQAGRNERAKLTEILRQYEQKIRSIFADASRIMQLSDQYKINAACVLAEAQCKSKVIACRISMINDLPPEILSYILEIAATTPPTHLMYARKPLSQVCRRWRDIVIGNQYLWSALDFSNITPAEKISEYLRRAGSAKLQIRISDPVNGKMGPRDAVPGDFFTSEAMNSVMDFLIPKISQVAHLVLLIRSWYPLLVALERFYQASNAPDALERLEIHRIGIADEENVLQPWTGSEHAFKLFNGRLPSLRIFIMDAIQCDWERTHLHGIRLLDLRSLPPQLSPTLDQLRGILSRSPELQQLHVHALAEESFTDAFISSVDPLNFPRLLTLTLGNLSPSQATCISKLISAPGLIELNIRCARDRGEEYGSVFSILARKFPSVRILQLTDFNAPPTLFNDASAVFTRFLFSMPNIELLRVGSIPSQFFTFFSSEALDAVQQLDLLPRWVLPKLLYIIADSISVDVLMEFIAIRRTMGLPLKRVFVVESWFNGAQVRQVQRDNLRGLVDVRLHPGYFVRPREEEGLWKEVML